MTKKHLTLQDREKLEALYLVVTSCFGLCAKSSWDRVALCRFSRWRSSISGGTSGIAGIGPGSDLWRAAVAQAFRL